LRPAVYEKATTKRTIVLVVDDPGVFSERLIMTSRSAPPRSFVFLASLIITLALLGLGGCTSDKYSTAPTPKGEWAPANIDPESKDNNILPDFAQGVVS
jgi:hypothetical protein